MLRTHVDLLGLRDFFKNFLNHDSVKVSNFTDGSDINFTELHTPALARREPWCKLDVIVTLDNVDI